MEPLSARRAPTAQPPKVVKNYCYHGIDAWLLYLVAQSAQVVLSF